MNKEEILARFEELYGKGGAIRLFFAPGRVNLIGEHTDYNGGHVFPCALTLGIYAAVRLRDDRTLRLASLEKQGGEMHTLYLDDLEKTEARGWTRYIRGLLLAFLADDTHIPYGADILYASDLPIGAGLSSSAALEVVTGTAIRTFFDLYALDNTSLAKLCQRAENVYVGIRSGIMDPYISLMGRKDTALFLSTTSMRSEYVPLHLKDTKIVIIDSGVHHTLGQSEYNLRREQCEKALRKLRSVANVHHLCDLSADRFESCKDVIMDETYTKRARHAIYEDARTIRAVNTLRVGNLVRFGELMKQSHISLRDDYEVSCPEIDFLVEKSWEIPGVYGSRITGGGFGGSVVALVKDDAVRNLEEVLGAAYAERFGIRAHFYSALAGDGAREL